MRYRGQPLGDWFYSRMAALAWSSLAVWVFLGPHNVELETIEVRHPYWRWIVIAYVFVCFDCFLLDRQATLEAARRRGEVPVPFTRRLLIIVIGGPIGAISWLVALAAMGGGYFAGGGWGLAVGALIAKLTYIPWIIGIVREARRKPSPPARTGVTTAHG